MTWGVWGLGREGLAALSYVRGTYPSTRVIVVDENPEATRDDLGPHGTDDLVTLYVGVDAPRHLLEADHVIVSPGVPGVHPIRRVLAEAGKDITSGTDLWMRGHAASTIGITGTKGKSTTTSLLAALLNTAGHPARVAGNIGVPLLSLPEANATTCVELSSYQCHSLTVSPRIAAITNLYQEHLTWHGSLKEYWRDKCRIFTQGADTLVVDPDTWASIDSLGITAGPTQIVTPTDDTKSLVNSGIEQVGPDLPFLFSSPHGLHNLILAAQIALQAGGDITASTVADTIAHFQALPHRLSLVARVHGRSWVDDTLSTSAESAIAALEALAGFGQRVIIVGGQSRGISYTPLNDYLLSQADLPYVVTTPTNGREIPQLYEKAHPDRVAHAESLDDAVRIANTLGEPCGTVVLSPAAPSYDLYTNFEAKSAAFTAAIETLV